MTGRSAPGEVGGHAPPHQFTPFFGFVAVDVQGAVDGIQEGLGLVITERKAVTHARILVQVFDGILQAAGCPDHRDGTIAQADHLPQAAGLEPGGHQEDIAPGVDMLGQDRVKADFHGHFIAIFYLISGEKLLVVVLAAAQEDELQVLLHQWVQDCGQEVETFLAHQAGDQAQDGDVPDGQFHLPLQGRLVFPFLLQVIGVVIDCQAPVGGRVELLIVDAVQDAPQVGCPFTEQAVQALPVLRRLDFQGVFLADGVHQVGVQDPGLHIADLPVKLQAFRDKEFLAEGHGLEDVAGKGTLVLQVMDGIDGCRLPVKRVVLVLYLEEQGYGTGLPVVTMDDIRLKLQPGQHGQHGFAEEIEPCGVIAVTIHAITVEKLVVVDQVYRDPGFPGQFPLANDGCLQAAVHLYRQIGEVVNLLDLAVTGHGYPDLVALGRQGFGQATGHISQAAGFGQGCNLGRNQQDLQGFVHRASSYLGCREVGGGKFSALRNFTSSPVHGCSLRLA
ncbi:SAM-dependent methyltransferases [Moorella thermoacetica Y72]|uniref:SAM-dependent methyltransferases n=1 Tax=Moorella thermoacetica Y72 TaxID=1325331 RepID=A0A0S6U9I5_NEOTH|nr:SAM-dependent methyltransferases [Moorella thermoacetica Y72]